MTFPSSPFPRTTFDGTPCTTWRPDKLYKSIGLPKCERCDSWECALPYYAWEQSRAERYGLANYTTHADCFVHSPPRDFPILRASPLWRQTFLQTERFLYYEDNRPAFRLFPPVSCTHVDGTRVVILDRRSDSRSTNAFLYSVDNCPDCTAALQAVELMVYGIAWEMQQWPDAWEHRCWFGGLDVGNLMMHDCTCGARDSLTNLHTWRWLADLAVSEWAVDNRTQHFDDPDATELFTSLTNFTGTTGADLTVENLLEAQNAFKATMTGSLVNPHPMFPDD